MLTTKASSRIKTYYEVTKPKIWYLLVFTAIGAAFTASNIYHTPISPLTWGLVIGGVIAGSAAANTLTNYNDRDIDAIMERTKDRPIPSRRIYPAKKALHFGLILTAISLICAFAINTWAGIFMAFGLADNILVYSKLLKRRSRTNIVLGGFSGGAPAMIGYVAVTTTGLWDLGLVMAGLVFVWIPMHIWSLTLHVKDDYNKVKV
ncbi:MAG: protoheme IX farnesyltransferase, partial [Nitrosopumilaceae archaeon]